MTGVARCLLIHEAVKATGMRRGSVLLISGLLFFTVPASREDEDFDLDEQLELEDVTEAGDPSVGTEIGGMCVDHCSEDLKHTFCNKATNKCECDHAHPLAYNNHICLAPLHLGELCSHTESCAFYDPNALCNKVTPYYFRCACKEEYQQASSGNGHDKCVPVKKELIVQTDVPTVLGVGVGMVLFTGLTCMVLRLFSNARFGQPRGHYADANLPPPITLTSTPSSAPHSRRSSGRSSGTAGSRRPSYTMLAPPSRSGSRRASSSSIRSQMSVRSCTSGRAERLSQHEILRPTMSAPSPDTLNSPYCTPNRSEQRIPICDDALSEEKEEILPSADALEVEEIVLSKPTTVTTAH